MDGGFPLRMNSLGVEQLERRGAGKPRSWIQGPGRGVGTE